jgi:hypothetical protein
MDMEIFKAMRQVPLDYAFTNSAYILRPAAVLFGQHFVFYCVIICCGVHWAVQNVDWTFALEIPRLACFNAADS